jgi:hypothetical protein
LQNTACALYGVVRPAGPVFVGAEVRRLATQYAAGRVDNHHLNLAMGFEF